MVDLENENGETALFYAVRSGHLDASVALLRAGADLSKTNRTGQTVFDLNVADPEIVDTLRQILRKQSP
jgi:ankyrin repeat protein